MDSALATPKWAATSTRELLDFYIEHEPPTPGHYPPLITTPPHPSIIEPPATDGLPNFLRFANYRLRRLEGKLYISGPPDDSLLLSHMGDLADSISLDDLYRLSAATIKEIIQARRCEDDEGYAHHTVVIVVWTKPSMPPRCYERSMSLSPVETQSAEPTYGWSISWDILLAAKFLMASTSLNLDDLVQQPEVLYGAQTCLYEVWDQGLQQWVTFAWTDTLKTATPRTFILIRRKESGAPDGMEGFLGLLKWAESGELIGAVHVVPESHE